MRDVEIEINTSGNPLEVNEEDVPETSVDAGGGAEDSSEDASAIEAEARSMGWRPKEGFKGSDKEWVDAATFVERGRQVLPIVASRNRQLTDQLKARDAQISIISKEVERLTSVAAKAEERAFKTARQNLLLQRNQHIADNQAQEAAQIDDAIAELDAMQAEAKREREDSVKAQKAAGEVPLPPELQEWRERNTWLKTPHLQAMGNAVMTKLHGRHPEWEGLKLLEEVTKEMVRIEPEEMAPWAGSSKTPSRSSPVTDGGGRSSPVNGKSFSQLPPEAKRACRSLISQGIIKSEKEYLASYEW